VAATVAILRHVAPDIVLINELDHDPDHDTAGALAERLASAEGSDATLSYPHRFSPPTNTGIPSGFDLDRDGEVGGPGDAWGYGAFAGQYGWALLSRHPIDRTRTRCFGTLPWRDLPGAELPDDPATPQPSDWYSEEARVSFPLSSKNHCDVVVTVDGNPLHLLASHPTPPVFDGPEDRNGLRNRDEIRLWSLYVAGTPLRDDAGRTAGLNPEAPFVILGDLNADPRDGDATGSPITEFLLASPRVSDPLPRSEGAVVAARQQGGANLQHRGPPATDTSDFPDDGPGNLRIDYVLPSTNVEVLDAGVFWPSPDEPGAEWVTRSDHRLVWVDLRLSGG
jgi:endonuclease/exonuclease/phosphatase family metal-dependent hydrolase